jgi:S-adenosyl-L-methionine hydrolase (adenosine-forming)
MAANGLITLLTDFGLEDTYVGVMKGVILQISPSATLIDLTHQVPPQNVALGAFQFGNAYRHFPSGTVHLAVVDPGVGSNRAAIAIETPDAFFVGPDNGIFSSVLLDSEQKSLLLRAVALDNPLYWYSPAPSQTFQGRDIFAAAAAYLAKGVSLPELGTPINLKQLVTLNQPPVQTLAMGLRGSVQAVDGFGNVISTIPANKVAGRNWLATAAGQVFHSASTYSDKSAGSTLSLVGSHGWVELSVNGGNAQQQYGLTLGDPIEVTWAYTEKAAPT